MQFHAEKSPKLQRRFDENWTRIWKSNSNSHCICHGSGTKSIVLFGIKEGFSERKSVRRFDVEFCKCKSYSKSYVRLLDKKESKIYKEYFVITNVITPYSSGSFAKLPPRLNSAAWSSGIKNNPLPVHALVLGNGFVFAFGIVVIHTQKETCKETRKTHQENGKTG